MPASLPACWCECYFKTKPNQICTCAVPGALTAGGWRATEQTNKEDAKQRDV